MTFNLQEHRLLHTVTVFPTRNHLVKSHFFCSCKYFPVNKSLLILACQRVSGLHWPHLAAFPHVVMALTPGCPRPSTCHTTAFGNPTYCTPAARQQAISSKESLLDFIITTNSAFCKSLGWKSKYYFV